VRRRPGTTIWKRSPPCRRRGWVPLSGPPRPRLAPSVLSSGTCRRECWGHPGHRHAGVIGPCEHGCSPRLCSSPSTPRPPFPLSIVLVYLFSISNISSASWFGRETQREDHVDHLGLHHDPNPRRVWLHCAGPALRAWIALKRPRVRLPPPPSSPPSVAPMGRPPTVTPSLRWIPDLVAIRSRWTPVPRSICPTSGTNWTTVAQNSTLLARVAGRKKVTQNSGAGTPTMSAPGRPMRRDEQVSRRGRLETLLGMIWVESRIRHGHFRGIAIGTSVLAQMTPRRPSL